jgi:hypothetical protein
MISSGHCCRVSPSAPTGKPCPATASGFRATNLLGDSDRIGGAVMPTAIEDAAYCISEDVEYVTVMPGSDTKIDATVFIQSEQFHLHQLAQDMLAQHFPTLHLAVVVLSAIPLTEQGKPNRLALSETRAREAAS